ncbi:MAG: DUF5716 family protein [Spirochaetaceae bacterium]|nr:DUF5716 family protein [Spirochaetaceae bacterium]
MNIFSLVPGNFFSILSSGNREIYFDALMLLNEYLKQSLNIPVGDYISSLTGLLEDRNFIVEKEDESPDMPDAVEGQGGYSSNTKAHLILNRIVNTGWADREILDGSFVEIITPRDYAIRMMQLLDEMRDEKIHEYSSLVFSTYSALKQANHEQPREYYDAVLAARRNTETLVYELKSLYHNIRSYIRRIQEQNSINELLENHFEKYKPMTDRIYHPIKTMDSFYRFMSPVRELLAEIREDEELLAGMRGRAMTVRKYDEEEAEAEILSAIDYVEDTYKVIGNIINEIDRKHGAYTKNSIEKMTYMMTADQSVKGKLLEIFKAYAAALSAARPLRERQREAMDSKLKGQVNIYRQQFIDGVSVFHRNPLGRRMGGEALEIADARSLSIEAMESLAKQMKNVYPPERICRFVESFFDSGRAVAESETLPINDDTDFILLILAVARSRERGMDYAVELQRGRVNVNGYVIPRMKFSRRGGNAVPEAAREKDHG